MLAVLEGPPPARAGLDVAELGRLLRLPRRQELPSDPTPAAPAASAPVELRVCQLGPGAYEIETPDRLDDIDHVRDTAMQARIVPAFKDGVAIGFKLFSIRPGSLYAQLGVVNGDIIRRINGHDLNSPEKALELYSQMRQATHFDLMLEREGRLLTQTYELIKPPREGWRCRPSTSASGR
ncbi:MAG: hypothetical protein IPJ65_16535 [Archangiaceae bacterium]|nr:hypothetical protein [Archangiaceae bacterium]